jgi:hypothetical protein
MNKEDEMLNNLLLQIEHPDGCHAVVFDDNGRVAYAYITEAGRIVADVWLYNRCEAPEQPEWRSKAPMPFLNAREYVSPSPFTPPSSVDQIRVEWSVPQQGEPLRASLFLRDSLHAVLTVGERPGACYMAAKDGPLARVLRVDDEPGDISDD